MKQGRAGAAERLCGDQIAAPGQGPAFISSAKPPTAAEVDHDAEGVVSAVEACHSHSAPAGGVPWLPSSSSV
jgi:hypothetical protein